jgi:hypothetical protein
MMSIFAVENIVNFALKTMSRARINPVASVHIAVRSATALDATEMI